MNLEQLRKQAKELVRAARAGDAAALERFGADPVRLATAQRLIARAHGHASWPALVLAREATVGQFVLAATEGRRERAERILAAAPELARDPWVALVLGRGWAGDPREPGGPREWSPLHYACHSAFDTLDVVRDLLQRGADPNVPYANDHGPMSTLYGAAGVRADPAMTALLLAHGADPNAEPWFGDALYHAASAPDPACLRLLLEAGARVPGSNALGSALDADRPEHVRLLLEAGADTDDGPLLVHAVRRGNSAAVIGLLLEHGAPVDMPGGEWSTPAEQYRTAHQNAYLRSRTDVLELLAAHGADTALKPGDEAVAALGRGERPAAPLPEEPDADQQEVISGAVIFGGHVDLVCDAVGASFFAHHGGGPPGTLLHHAAWLGNAPVVRRLLERGADPVAPSGAEFATPLAWAVHGSSHHGVAGRDHVAVAALLLAAGARLEERFEDAAEGPLAAWLATQELRA